MTATQPERRYHRGNVRADLIKAALKVLKKEGVSAVTLTGLAQAIGVSTPAVYNHFRNKEALLAAVAVAGYRRLIAREKVALSGASPEGRLRAVAVAYLRFALAEPNLYRLMFRREIENRSLYPELIEAEDEAFALAGRILEPMIDPTRRPQDYPRAFLPWATLHGIAMLMSDRQVAFRDDRELEAIAAMAVEAHLAP